VRKEGLGRFPFVVASEVWGGGSKERAEGGERPNGSAPADRSSYKIDQRGGKEKVQFEKDWEKKVTRRQERPREGKQNH